MVYGMTSLATTTTYLVWVVRDQLVSIILFTAFENV